jgi:chromosome partitioning protein
MWRFGCHKISSGGAVEDMPTITFANTKGGAGKTTAVLLLAMELVERGYRVSIVDADPQRWISRWFEGAPFLPNLTVATYVSLQALPRTVAEYRPVSDFVIVDLPGAQSPLLATSLSLSDFVIIPIQGSPMDAQGGAQVLDLLSYLGKRAGMHIPHAVLLSRVNSFRNTKALQSVKLLLQSRGVGMFDTPIMERSAYRDMFETREMLRRLNPARVSNLPKAIQNAETYANEVEAFVATLMHGLPAEVLSAA